MKVVRLATKFHNIPGLPLPFLEMERLSENITAENADIYHINNRYQYFHRTIRTIKDTGKKLALTIHNALPREIDLETDMVGYAFDVCWGRPLMKKADIITTVSENTKTTTVPKRYYNKTCVITNGVDFKKFRFRSGRRILKIKNDLGFEGRVVLNTARLVRQKGQIYLIRAVAKLKNEGVLGEGVNLLLIGRGPLLRMLKDEAARLGLKGDFAVVEWIADRDLPYYYNTADVYAMPSLYEPAGLAIMEAMASEIPSVASNVGGLPGIVRNGGVYAEPRDVDALAERIRMLIENKKTALVLARNARKLVVKYHDWDRIVGIYEKKFEETIRY
jgi:glycosyltransferase involved in cell wall biosynthesis